MKNLLFAKCQLVFLACLLLGNISLEAQNEGVVLNDFKAFSFISNDQVADSLDYKPEVPSGGPIQFLEDSLVIVTPDGAFQLNYTPNDTKAFVAIWVDANNNGLFEAEEAIYEGEANEGNLTDTLNLPIFIGSRPALVAISNDQKNLVDPREIPGNPEISSLRFIMLSNPPKLATTTKKETIDSSLPVYCDTLVTFSLHNDISSICVFAQGWSISYPSVVNAPVTVTQSPGSASYGAGQMLLPGGTVDLALDISSLPIVDGDIVTLTFHFANCYDTTQVYSFNFQFIKCMTVNSRDFNSELDHAINLTISPNPIRSSAIIEYEILKSSQVQLALRSVTGQLIETIQAVKVMPGEHRLTYAPPSLPDGIYLLSLQTNYGVISKKIVIFDH